MKLKLAVGSIVFAAVAAAAAIPPPEVQIASAILAAPADLREGAAVLGYNPQGELVKLREGKNELICLASDPAKTSFSVACYHRDLEPYMARGRELWLKKSPGRSATTFAGRRLRKESWRCHTSLERSTCSAAAASTPPAGK